MRIAADIAERVLNFTFGEKTPASMLRLHVAAIVRHEDDTARRFAVLPRTGGDQRRHANSACPVSSPSKGRTAGGAGEKEPLAIRYPSILGFKHAYLYQMQRLGEEPSLPRRPLAETPSCSSAGGGGTAR